MEEKIIEFKLGNGGRFTGRVISSKLVISKNKDFKGNSITLILSKKGNVYCFQPITDIYLDYNNTELIMPKYVPVPIASALYRDIIPSIKYKGHYVFAPDSDFQTVFKEVELSDGKKFWCIVFETITLHLYTWYEDLFFIGDCRGEEFSSYLSTHQIKFRKKQEEKRNAEYLREWNDECQRMTDELFEEAGYDFMD